MERRGEELFTGIGEGLGGDRDRFLDADGAHVLEAGFLHRASGGKSSSNLYPKRRVLSM